MLKQMDANEMRENGLTILLDNSSQINRYWLTRLVRYLSLQTYLN